MYVCVSVCMYVCMCECKYVRMYVCMCVFLYVCMCVYVCMHIFSPSNFHLHTQVESLWLRLRHVKDCKEK